MADDTIQPLVERLACDLVLADPTDADTLSCLLPLLKKLHDECRSRTMNEQAGQMVKAREIIQTMIKKGGRMPVAGWSASMKSPRNCPVQCACPHL